MHRREDAAPPRHRLWLALSLSGVLAAGLVVAHISGESPDKDHPKRIELIKQIGPRV